MPNRDLALTALQDRLRRAREQHDPTLLLTQDAELIAADLAAAADTGTDVEAAGALGWFHWLRHQDQGSAGGEDGEDFHAAMRLFQVVCPADSADVPDEVRIFFEYEESAAQVGALAASRRSIQLRGDYERGGHQDLSVLHEAIAAGREAVAATAAGDPNRPRRLSNLGYALQLLFERSGETGVLDEAIRVGRDALAASSRADHDRAKYLTNLSGALMLKFWRTEDAAVLDEVVQLGRGAIAATRPGDPDRVSRLVNLTSALLPMSSRPGDEGALTEESSLGERPWRPVRRTIPSAMPA